MGNSIFKTMGRQLGQVIERKQGCWNCKHFDHDRGKAYWKEARQRDLEKALKLALESPMGEDDIKVQNIKNMVDRVDHGLASRGLGACTGKGVDRHGNPVGDLVQSTYLCKNWSGAQGASVARAGEAADDLPAELEDKLS